MVNIGQGITRRSFANAVGGRMVKWKGGVASVAPNIMSVSVVALMSMGALSDYALAETIADARTAEVYIGADENVTITSTGSISAINSTSDDTLLEVSPGAPYTSTIQNDGTLTALLQDESSITGIWVDADLAGVVNNTGTIRLLLSNSSSDGSAWGIYTDSVSGQITNSGLIDVAVNIDSSSHAEAYGIYVDSIASGGSVANTNTGTIRVEATTETGDSASAYGIYVNNDVAGVLDNAGLIDVQAISRSSSATAYGIYVGGDVTGDGALTNSGTIKSYAKTQSDSTAIAYGIYVSGEVDGRIENSGLIEATSVSTTDDADGYGIYLSNSVGVDGTVTNTVDGIIRVDVNSESYATGYGIYVGGNVDGTLDNAGKIEVTVVSSGSTATGYGIYVGDAVNGSVENSGQISVQATSPTSYATAYGIYVNNQVAIDGAVTNSGSIVVKANSRSSTAHAYGIYVDSGVAGRVENAGLIDVLAQSRTDDARAYGMKIYGGVMVDGAVTNTNSGSIVVKADTIFDSASAYGIYVSGDVAGSIENAGLIDVLAQATTSEASAFGMAIFGDVTVDGAVTNSGIIKSSAIANNTSSASAYGIYVPGSVAGSITNTATGIIDVKATADSYDAVAYGVSVRNTMSGSIDNAGLIDVAADGKSYMSAYGILINSGVGTTGSIDNAATGIIKVTATAMSSSGSAYGIRTYGTISGSISNAGLIDVATNVQDYGSAYGIFVSSVGTTGSIDNAATGIIRVRTSSTDASGSAGGVRVGSTMSGSISNSGLIDVAADVTQSGTAHGIYANAVDATGSITNTGTILVEANSSNETTDAAAYGVKSDNFAGTFTNSGKISALDDGTIGDAIMLTGTGDVQLDTSGVLIGNIVLNGGVTLNVQGARGGSVYWTVANDTSVDNDFNPQGTDFNLLGTDFNLLGTDVPVFTRNLNTATAEFATFDASGIVGDHNANADASFMSLGTLADQTGKRAAGATGLVTRGPDGTSGLTPYVSIETKSANYDGGDTTFGQSTQTTAINFGETKLLGNGMALGFGGGLLRGDSAVAAIFAPSSDITTNGGFAGVSLAGTASGLNFGGSLTAGMLQHQSNRTMNDNLEFDGFQTAVGTYDSRFVALQLDLSTHLALGDGMALVPSAALRYANHMVDGYTETGSDANATVAGQNFGVAEGEIGVSLERTVGVGVLSAGGSYVARNVSGNDTTDVTLIDDTHALSTAIGNTGGAKISTAYSANTGNNVNIDFAAEALVGSNGMSGQKASLQVRFAF